MDVILGASIGIVSSVISSLLTYYFVWRREDKLRKEEYQREDELKKEELKVKRIEAAHEYYRGLYNPLKPFLRACSVLSLGLLAQFVQDEYTKIFSNEITTLVEATRNLVNEGYAALFPSELFGTILTLQVLLSRIDSILKEKTIKDFNLDDNKLLRDLAGTLNKLRDQIRSLLDVDAL